MKRRYNVTPYYKYDDTYESEEVRISPKKNLFKTVDGIKRKELSKYKTYDALLVKSWFVSSKETAPVKYYQLTNDLGDLVDYHELGTFITTQRIRNRKIDALIS